MPVKPIRPNDVFARKAETIPDQVFEAFNELLAERGLTGGTICIQQQEIVDRLVESGLDREEIFDRHWLDIDDFYRAAGWDVEYDRPAWCETYEPKWYFKKRR